MCVLLFKELFPATLSRAIKLFREYSASVADPVHKCYSNFCYFLKTLLCFSNRENEIENGMVLGREKKHALGVFVITHKGKKFRLIVSIRCSLFDLVESPRRYDFDHSYLEKVKMVRIYSTYMTRDSIRQPLYHFPLDPKDLKGSASSSRGSR